MALLRIKTQKLLGSSQKSIMVKGKIHSFYYTTITLMDTKIALDMLLPSLPFKAAYSFNGQVVTVSINKQPRELFLGGGRS